MLMLAAHAGLRCAEIAAVHTRDAVDGVLRVHGKGGRVRSVPLTSALEQAITSMPAGYAFPGADRGHLSAHWVGRVIADALGGGWTAHTLRHAFATKAYAADRDLLAVQQLLGHSNPQTTARYASVPTESLVRAVQSAAGARGRSMLFIAEGHPALKAVAWLYASGLQPLEILELAWRDVDLENGNVVTDRGVTPLSVAAQLALLDADGARLDLGSFELGIDRRAKVNVLVAIYWEGHAEEYWGRVPTWQSIEAPLRQWLRDAGGITKLSDLRSLLPA